MARALCRRTDAHRERALESRRVARDRAYGKHGRRGPRRQARARHSRRTHGGAGSRGGDRGARSRGLPVSRRAGHRGPRLLPARRASTVSSASRAGRQRVLERASAVPRLPSDGSGRCGFVRIAQARTGCPPSSRPGSLYRRQDVVRASRARPTERTPTSADRRHRMTRRRQGDAMKFFRTAFSILLAASSLAAQSTAPAKPTAPKITVVKAARLVDPKSGGVISNAMIIVQDDKVTQVGTGLTIPAGAEVIDLKGATILPGLIDCHTHITSQPSDYYEDIFRKSPIDYAVIAHVYARRTIEAGFTTVRDVGSAEYIDVALKRAIDKGDVVGPRMVPAGLAISSTGGHGDLTGFSPYVKIEGLSGVADGVAEIRKLVRNNVKYGADVIKVLAGGGVLSEEEN